MSEQDHKGPTVVCSVFVQKNGKFLVVLCPRFKVWRVPGGRAELGESLETTAIREMQEELGVTLDKVTFLGWEQDQMYHHKGQFETDRLLMFFHASTDQDIIVDPDEADDFRWVTIEEMRNIPEKEVALEKFLASPQCIL